MIDELFSELESLSAITRNFSNSNEICLGYFKEVQVGEK